MTRKLTSLALAALFACAASTSVFAAAPLVKAPNPGYFHMMLGDFEVTAIGDGTIELPVNTLITGMKPAQVDAELAKVYLKSPLDTSVNGFVVNTGSKLVLVDTGCGDSGAFGPNVGRFLANLKAAGYTPEQVDEIYITHLHPDHVGGLLIGGKMAFPNAIVRAQKKEADFWLSQANLDKAAADAKGFFKAAQAAMQPYVAAGKFKPFEGDTELVPGIRAHAGDGHTPGHSRYLVESKGQKLILVGDLIHVAGVQMAHPELTVGFDSNAKEAAAERKQEFDAAAKGGYLVGAPHIQFPGLGHLVKQGKGYNWIPVNYSSVR